MSVPAASILRIEESGGRHSNLGRGAARGAIVGVLAGVIAGAGTGGSSDNCTSNCTTAGDAIATNAVFVGMLGLSVGSVVGLLTSHEEWRVMPMATIGRATGASTVGIVLHFRF